MLIAVASQNRREVTGHAGACRRFWIYEVWHDRVHDKSLLELRREQTFHENHAHTHPLDPVRALIAGGMGAGLVRRLEAKGIDAVITPETDPDAAVSAYLAGTLERAEPETHVHRPDAGGHVCHCAESE